MWHSWWRGVHRVLIGRSEWRRPLGRPRRKWEDNIKMDLREIGFSGANWIRLAQDRVRWRGFVSTVMSLRVLWSKCTNRVMTVEFLCYVLNVSAPVH
jgi:hypothetical protein